MMRQTIIILVTILLAGVGSSSRAAEEFYVYPAKGQSEKQQARDQQECHDWAVKQTGVDPVKLAEQTPETQTSSRGGLLKGAAGGAGLGALRGTVGGEPGEMAGRGAAMGGIFAAIRARRAMQEEHDAHMQTHQDREAQLVKYDRAYKVCLSGRGYAVN
jgi:hypothetical protein